MLNIFNKENLLDRFIRLRFHQYPISYIDRPVDGWIPYTSADLPEAAGSGSYVHIYIRGCPCGGLSVSRNAPQGNYLFLDLFIHCKTSVFSDIPRSRQW